MMAWCSAPVRVLQDNKSVNSGVAQTVEGSIPEAAVTGRSTGRPLPKKFTAGKEEALGDE
jgi:hypothetical protein